MCNRFKNKVVLVTGGGSGIGRTTAIAFAKEEAKVVVTDIQVAEGEKTVQLIKEAGGEAIFIKTDVSQANEVEALIKKIIEQYGRLDCAYNNAAIEGITANTADCTEENWDKVIDTNLKGIWLCMKYEIPEMLKQGGGAIVNCASNASITGFRGVPAYVASKHGVLGLTKTAGLEYATANIRVNAVCPGIIHTAMIDRFTGGGQPEGLAQLAALEPIGRLGRPEEIAMAVLWLCTEEASFVIGAGVVVDGGMTIQ